VNRAVDLALIVDATSRPIVLSSNDMRVAPDSIEATLPVSVGSQTVDLRLQMETALDGAAVTLRVSAPASLPGTTALQALLTSDPDGVFVSGIGQITDAASVSGRALFTGSQALSVGVAPTQGTILVDTLFEESATPDEPMRVSVTENLRRSQGTQHAELHFVVGESSSDIWGTLGRLSGEATAKVRGRVIGAREPAYVIGRNALGQSQLRTVSARDGSFSVDAPVSVVQWYALADAGRASGIVPFVPGTPRDLLLDVSPGADFHVTVVDADTHEPLTARLLFHGLDGTIDPNFGPDYRASGAGPIIDALRGAVVTHLPAGKYRVSATKGIEWSIDSQIVDIVADHPTSVELAPRHVVPTPDIVGCDLHVHARPSFDSRVSPEDRVLSLAAAGIDFAVPTEHNVVGDYSSAISALDFARTFASVPGVEVTTYNFGFGHFGVFPFSPRSNVPPYLHTNIGAIFRAVRSDSHRYFQLNHPRLPGGIGYFNNIGFDPQAPRSHVTNRVDFDGIEVYNGFDIKEPERVEQILRDYWALLDFGWRYTATGSSDSHRIQYQWAGYPRTMVTLDGDAEDRPVDPLAVVANLKKGHATVTSGPLIELTVAGAHPGDEAVTTEEDIRGHLRIRAAPWIDLTTVEIVVGQVDGGCNVVQSFDVPAQPTEVGPELGTLEEAQNRTIRLDRDIDVPMGPANGWVQVVARGKRLMSDVLPFVPVAPLAFTNPVYVVRRRTPIPPFPGAPSSVR
jgi:hypothetical protein